MPKKSKSPKSSEPTATYRDKIPPRPTTETWQQPLVSGEKREVTNTPARYF